MRIRIGKLVISWGDPCDLQECDYYSHYLRYGPPDLNHAAYHRASQECALWQQRLFEYLGREGKVPPTLTRLVERLEKEVRA